MNKFIVNAANLKHNINFVKSRLNKGVLFCAMVKANAYGHGLKQAAKNIQNEADYFGVACVSEGIILRSSNIAKPVLVVGAYDRGAARQGVLNYLTLTLCTPDDILHLGKICKKLNMVCDVHIKINTGMNRLGVNNKLIFIKMLNLLKDNMYVKLKGVFSHFSMSDINQKYTARQNRIFKSYIKLCKQKITHPLIFHISSSFAALNYKKYNYDMVRVGLAMYGYGNKNLKPAITIKSEIKAVSFVKKGSLVGYGGTFKTERDSKIAVIPLGYADGINLKLSNAFKIRVAGRICAQKFPSNIEGCPLLPQKVSGRYFLGTPGAGCVISVPVVGRICMDMFMCDVTGTDIKAGDSVTVFDEQNNAAVWAKICGNHEYEILTSFKTNRMKVIYLK